MQSRPSQLGLGVGKGDSNVQATVNSAVISLFVFTVPWLGAIAGFSNLWIRSFGNNVTMWTAVGALVSIAALVQQYWIRTQLEQTVQLPRTYWWLSGLGGLVVAAIAIGSWIKTETGWGWTWRGRKLRLDD